MQELVNLKRVFCRYDIDESGSISRNELKLVISEFRPELSEEEVEAEVEHFFAEANSQAAENDDGTEGDDDAIDFQEFLQAMYNARRDGKTTKFSTMADNVEAQIRGQGQIICYFFLTLTYIVFISTSTKIFSFLKCQTFSDPETGDRSYLVKDMTIDCESSRYKVMLVFDIVMIFIYPIGSKDPLFLPSSLCMCYPYVFSLLLTS